MAISAGQISNLGTIVQLRGQFNNLVTDVSALESGTINFSNLSATTINVGDLNVSGAFDIPNITATSLTISGSSITFEGATADAFETTFTVTDPTADRTITFPNTSGTVLLDGGTIDLGSSETHVGA